MMKQKIMRMMGTYYRAVLAVSLALALMGGCHSSSGGDKTPPSQPSITSPAGGSVFNTNTVTFSGTGEANSTIEVFANDGAMDQSLGTVTADANGNWTFTSPDLVALLGEGTYTIKVTATDEAGNTSAISSGVRVTVDMSKLSTPVITSPADGAATNNNTPEVTGTAQAGAIVEIFSGAASLGKATADPGGQWTFTPGTALADGTHALTTTATDTKGNVSGSSVPVTITIDATPPTVLVNALATNNLTPQVTGTVADAGSGVASVSATVNGTTYGAVVTGGAWTLAVTGALPEGLYDVAVTATDQLGNAGPDSTTGELEIDLTAPLVSSTRPAAGATNTDRQISADVTFNDDMDAASLNPATVTIADSGSNPVTGTVSYDAARKTATFAPGAILTAGETYTVTVTTGVEDSAGNALAANFAFTFTTGGATDTTPPVVTLFAIDSPDPFNSTTVALTFQATDFGGTGVQRYLIREDDATAPTPADFVAATSPSAYTLQGGEGPHTLYAWVLDGVSPTPLVSTSAKTAPLTIDLTSPTLGGIAPGRSVTGVGLATNIQILFSETMDKSATEAILSLTPAPFHGLVFSWRTIDNPDDTVTIVPDTGDPVGVGNEDVLAPNTTYTVSAAGAKDLAGNTFVGTASFSFTTVNLKLVDVTIMAGTTNVENGPVPTSDVEGGDTIAFTFGADGDQTSGRIAIDGDDLAIRAQVGDPSDGGTLAWTSPTTLTFTLDPEISLPAGQQFHYDVLDLIFWSAGVSVAIDGFLQVEQSPSVDTTAPSVLSSIPKDGETGVNRDEIVVISFSEPIDHSTLSNITWSGTGVTTADLVREHGEHDASFQRVLYFIPQAALPASTAVTATIPTTVKDLAGNGLAQEVRITFTTAAAAADTGKPAIAATIPNDGDTVGQGGTIQIAFKDSVSGKAEVLDVAGIGSDDFRVTNTTMGQLFRGFTVEAQAGSNIVELTAPIGGPALGILRMIRVVTDVAAAAGTVTYTTSTAHRLTVGETVYVVDLSNPTYDVPGPNGGIVASVPSPTTFTVSSGAPDGSLTGETNAYAIWFLEQTYTVEVGTGSGISDVAGNKMDPASFSFTVSPSQTNRLPLPEELDFHVAGSTSPVARALDARFNIRDPDADAVTVTVTGLGGVNISKSVSASQNDGLGWFDHGPDGPPDKAEPGMDDTNYPTSGNYTFTLKLDDGKGGTSTYTKDAWVWRPDAVPAPSSIAGQSVTGVTEPILLTVATPALVWSNVDTANADRLRVSVMDMAALRDGSGYSIATLLHPTLTSFTVPDDQPLPVGIYLWAVVQQKMGADFEEPVGEGWSVDLANPALSTFIYATGNAGLASSFGVAQLGVEFTEDPGTTAVRFADTSGAYGTYTFDGTKKVTTNLTWDDGTSAAGTDFYAYEASELVVSRGGMKSVERGSTGQAGKLFFLNLEEKEEASLSVGARRFATSGFTAASMNGTWSVAWIEIEMDATKAFQNISAFVGTGTFDSTAGTLDASLTHHDGSSSSPTGLTYSVTDAGLLTITLDMATGEKVSGYIGGSSGSEIAVLAADADAGHPQIMVLAKNFDLSGKTVADVTGTYRLVALNIEKNTDGTFADAGAGRGTITFDGNGTATLVESVFTETLTYTVDAGGNKRVVLDDAHLFAGPDLNTLFGITVGDANSIQLLILSK